MLVTCLAELFENLKMPVFRAKPENFATHPGPNAGARKRKVTCHILSIPPTDQGGVEFMIRKLFAGVAIAGLISLGTALSVRSVPASQAGSDKQEQKATKSVSGKVTKIGNGGHSFSLEVTGENKNNMEFVVDRNTQVTGQVREGTAVTVEYQAMESGQNLAVSITAQA